MKRRVLLGGGALISILLVGGLFVWLTSDTTPKQAKKTTTPTTVTSNLSDYKTSEVDEVRKQYTDPTTRYNRLVSYAMSKENFQKYDEAIVYYKAAAEESVETANKELANYRIYRLAKLSKNSSLEADYKKLLGQKTIDTYENQGTPDDEKAE